MQLLALAVRLWLRAPAVAWLPMSIALPSRVQMRHRMVMPPLVALAVVAVIISVLHQSIGCAAFPLGLYRQNLYN